MAEKGIVANDENLEQILNLVKERCVFLNDFVEQAGFFFKPSDTPDIASIKPKWDEKKNMFFIELIRSYELSTLWEAVDLETEFKEQASAHQLKPGELMLPFRIMLVGGKFGPGVFEIAAILGRDETLSRIKKVLGMLE